MFLSLKGAIHGALRWSERYTKTDMVYLASGGFWLGASNVLGAGLSLVISILFAHYIPKETFGIYKYILSMAGIATAFSLTGMNAAITRAVSRGFEGIFKRSFPVQARWALLQCVFSLAVAVYYFYQGNSMYGLAFLAVAILSPASSISNTLFGYLNGKKDFKRMGLWSIEANVVATIIMSLVIIYVPNFTLLVLTYFLASTVTNFYFTWRTFKYYTPNDAFNEEDMAYGKHLSFANGFSIIALQIDNVLVYHFLGPIELALYTFSILIPDRVRALLGSVSSLALPKLSVSVDRTSVPILIDRSLRILALGIILAIGYALLVHPLFSIFFPAYINVTAMSAIYGLSLLAILGAYSNSMLLASGNTNALYSVNISAAIIRILFVTIGIMYFGLIGAIIARILVLYIQSVLPYLSLQLMAPKNRV